MVGNNKTKNEIMNKFDYFDLKTSRKISDTSKKLKSGQENTVASHNCLKLSCLTISLLKKKQ